MVKIGRRGVWEMIQPYQGSGEPIIDIGRVEKIYDLGKENIVRALGWSRSQDL